ncbi:hypothetical protein B0H63DRAFT_486997 [Podospora didyma]|uniref:Uncharacterized protein n=1 Tax=Podospora didyma TaxID=330526 RepID=A0AAE0N4G3_9PEZI|nr:hypothetical protein B0H63DRAFT_486997 [Podospora didyma]
MFRSCSCSIILLPLVLFLHGSILATEAILLAAGTGPIERGDRLPVFYNFTVAIIDASQYSTVPPSQQGKTPEWGLPDPLDGDKLMDFFVIYPTSYCSGRLKDRGRGVYFEHCSRWGKELFNLQGGWRNSGVDLVKNNLIGQTPNIIYILFLTALAVNALALILGVFAFCSFWAMVAATVVAWISAATILTISALSHAFATKLANEVPRLDVSGTGRLYAYRGIAYAHATWGESACALVVAFLWLLIAWRTHVARRRSRAAAAGRLLGMKGAPTSYQHMGSGYEMDPLQGSQVELIQRGRSPSRAGFEQSGNGVAYEPFRHR